MAINLTHSLNSKEKFGDETLAKALKGFDKEDTGKINAEEFKKVMVTLGDVLKDHEVIVMFLIDELLKKVDFVLNDVEIGKDKSFDIREMVDLLMLKEFK